MAGSDRSNADDVTAFSEEEAAQRNDRLESEEGEGQEAEAKKLDLDVKIEERSACERHITVSIPREDIDRYYDKEFSELVKSAQVPGFRPGRAPRKLIETRFRKDVAVRVKNELLADSIAQLSEKEDLAVISEPSIDLDAIEIPAEGPMTFEFDLEVRPEFDVPRWKGLRIERPVRQFTDADVEAELKNLLGRQGKLVPREAPAEMGDYITTNLTLTYQGNVISSAKEEVIRIRPVLSFRDGKIEDFGARMVGVRAGETRTAEAKLTEDAPNAALRGQTVTATFEVLEVKRLELPELTPEFLDDLGGFESEAELRDAIRSDLERRLEYHQRQRAREQIAQALTVSANWDLPPSLLERQSTRELARAVMELRRSGFTDEQIRVYENELRQNSRRATARALKEHFILEKIAEQEGITAEREDYDEEIRLIARQSNETPRRVRARLEKAGVMDALRNQIVERKVIDRILSEAVFVDVPYEPEEPAAEAIDRAAGGGEPESDIPEAKPEGAAAKHEHRTPES